ncbi:4933_t:CDS:2, partial [Dentiscutata heterogama]
FKVGSTYCISAFVTMIGTPQMLVTHIPLAGADSCAALIRSTDSSFADQVKYSSFADEQISIVVSQISIDEIIAD